MNHKLSNESDNRYYRVQANVNLEGIRHNILEIKNKLNKDTKLMLIIKADAYGHGAIPIAEYICHDNLADIYGVAIIEEAIELRDAGINIPILVLGYTPKEQYQLVVAHNVIQTVFQYEMAKELSKEAKRQGKIIKIHIKIDTGMSRVGFSDNNQSIDEIKRINDLDNIEIEGVYSHFATADESDTSSTNKQLKRFKEFVDKLVQEGIHIPIKHISNSAGILDYPDAEFNMVRCGIVAYGIYPSEFVLKDEVKLIPAMELKTHVIYVKDVDEGVGISYGSTYVTLKKTKVATIPVGYADGYSRNLSNVGKVIINGQYAPIIGRICMDQFMVDVTHIPEVKQGDTVTLLGKDQEAYISSEELAEWSHSFVYELICTVGKRIPRVYH
ncbi:MAG TPA: alanine racemase [Clostridiales bacterium]|nr:alanine racemase [Clostridiales bacterium]